MAAADHNLSRRAVLGAAVVPLLARHPGLDPGSTGLPTPETERWIPDQVRNDGKWERALAAFRAAEVELRHYETLTAGAPWEEQAAIEEAYGDRLDAMYAALRRLMRVRAPDLPGLATKIVLAVDHEVATLTGGEACMAALKRDVLRLARFG